MHNWLFHCLQLNRRCHSLNLCRLLWCFLLYSRYHRRCRIVPWFLHNKRQELFRSLGLYFRNSRTWQSRAASCSASFGLVTKLSDPQSCLELCLESLERVFVELHQNFPCYSFLFTNFRDPGNTSLALVSFEFTLTLLRLVRVPWEFGSKWQINLEFCGGWQCSEQGQT